METTHVMKINLNEIDMEQFMCHPHVWHNEVLWLVQPQHIGTKWTQANKHFRSSLWNEDGELVSAGFAKFTNWGENPEHFPTPESLKDCVCTEKLDGSLLIVSKYKGKFILRTRGTVDASKLDNGHELELFKQTILPKLDGDSDTWKISILFEWLTPSNRIVINYGTEPQFKLVGVVRHQDYSLVNQSELDQWAKQHGLLRPETYSFDSISDLLEMVDKWEGKEGVCLYSNKGQAIHKVKSAWYLVRHRLKEEFSNFEKVLDFYILEGCQAYDTFQSRIAEVTDWETAMEIRGDISRCVDAWKEVQKILSGMTFFVSNTLLPLGDPKDKKNRGAMAKKVLDSYGNTNRASFVFKLLDGRPLDNDDLKKLYYQVLK